MTKDEALKLIGDELDRALAKHKVGFVTNRHGHSVIEEEYTEFRTEVFADHHDAAIHEVVHLGAMAARYLMDQGCLNIFDPAHPTAVAKQ